MDTDGTEGQPARAAGDGPPAPRQIQIGAGAAVQERTYDEQDARIREMYAGQLQLRARHRREQALRSQKLMSVAQTMLATRCGAVQGQAQPQLARAASDPEYAKNMFEGRLSDDVTVMAVDLLADVQRQLDVLAERHRKDETAYMRSLAANLVKEAAQAGAASLKSGFHGAADKSGELKGTGRLEFLELEALASEKSLAEVEEAQRSAQGEAPAPAAADRQGQAGLGQGEPLALGASGGEPLPAQLLGCLDYFEEDRLIRLMVGHNQMAEYDKAQSWDISEPPRRNYKLDGVKIKGKRGYTLPSPPVSAEEAEAATRELNGGYLETMGDLVRGAHAALAKGPVQDYYRDLISSADRSGRDLSPVEKIIDHYKDGWVVTAVCPGSESVGPLGVKTASVWCDGNQMAGPTANYDCIVLLGVERGWTPSLQNLEKPDSGVTRLYFMGLHTVICEASSMEEHVPQCTSKNMAIGFCLVGDGLGEVRPLVMSKLQTKRSDSTWKRMGPLEESRTKQKDGTTKMEQSECLAVFLPTIMCGASARGWLRRNKETGLSHAVQQGPKCSFWTPCWERRIEVIVAEAIQANEYATQLLALAAKVMNMRVSRWVLQAATVAERTMESYGLIKSLAVVLEDMYVRMSLKVRSSQEGADSPAHKEAAGKQLDMYYKVCDLAWRNQRIMFRAMASLKRNDQSHPQKK